MLKIAYVTYAEVSNEIAILNGKRVKKISKLIDEMKNEDYIYDKVNVDLVKFGDESLTENDILDKAKKLLLDMYYEVKVEPLKAESIKPAYQSVNKFQSRPIISLIYGIARKETTDNLELENTANYEKLDEEIKKTNELLMILKELQKKDHSKSFLIILRYSLI